jgi:hypothetical protein
MVFFTTLSLLLAFATSAQAYVLCADAKGLVRLRTGSSCKPKEMLVDPAALGLVGPKSEKAEPSAVAPRAPGGAAVVSGEGQRVPATGVAEKEPSAAKSAMPNVAYKEGQGFVLTTPDDRFQLALGGYIQFRYTLTDIDHAYENPSKGTEDSQSFDIPRARVWWQGHAFTPKLNYKLEIELTAAGGDLPRDFYLTYDLVEKNWLILKGGQWKVPFCRQEMTPDPRQGFTDRSLACNNLRFERDRGIQLYGTPANSLVEYYAGIFNGTGRNGPANPDNNFLYSARLATNPFGPVGYSEEGVAWSPAPLLGIGVGYVYDKVRADEFTTAATAGPDPNNPDKLILASSGGQKINTPFLRTIQPFYNALSNPGDATAEVQNLEGDIAFKWMGLFISAEYLRAWVENSQHAGAAKPIPPFKFVPNSIRPWGYYTDVGYFILPKRLQIGFRYSELTPDDQSTVKKGNGRVIVPRQTEMLGAINYYFWEHNLKLMSDFGSVTSMGVKDVAGNVQDRDDFRLRIQAQLVF